MAYDAKLDKELKRFDLGDISVSVHQYNGGSPKVQISRMYESKVTGEVGYGKAGRLSVDEFADIIAKAEEITDALKGGKKAAAPKTKTKKKKAANDE